MTQKPMLQVEMYARAMRASQNVKKAEVWLARDAPYGINSLPLDCLVVYT